MNVSGEISRGFTVVELVVVIILLSILSVVAIGRIAGPGAWYGELLATSLLAELRYGQQLALARSDTQVILAIHRDTESWRIESATSADGVLRSQQVEVGDTRVTATNGSLSHEVITSQPVTIAFNTQGELASVQLGASAGSAGEGLQLNITGQRSESLCLYNTGFSSHAACR